MNHTPESVAAPPTELLRGASLFLDFDGTLVDITATPDAVVVTEQLRRLLATLLERLGQRVAIITGRSASSVEELFKPVPIIVGGSHGLEIPGERGHDRIERPAVLDEIVSELREVERTYPGVLLEMKPLGVALHYRQAPDAERACRTAAHDAAARTGLEVQAGKMVFELKPRGGDKGAAVRTLMSRPPFKDSQPVFVGDDLTDEPGFAAARKLGGSGVLIGDPRPTAAYYRLPSVADALDWLDRAGEAAV